MTELQERKIYVLNLKIDRIKESTGFLKRNFVKALLFGVAFSFLCPMYSGSSHYGTHQNRKSIMERAGTDYLTLVLYFFLGYVFVCLLGHVVFHYQDKFRIRKMEEEIKMIKEQAKK
ncbi:hypothetical protein [Pseudofulvibacter geojedonensis]|uniref:DUF4234 domain-containing protein n=1 Tax=Pseudofulvibacter geojedonensis TaxID=1123758 RepID=A0ABW3I5F2_9FLAO